MTEERFSRTEMLIGRGAAAMLKDRHVAVFGVGGVGGYACEALARSGIGAFDLIDPDCVAESNINRQIIATYRTLGRGKAEVMKERILDIMPEAEVHVRPLFFLPECADGIPFQDYDYVIDAVDTVTAKIEIIRRAVEARVPVISAMGAGNRLDPSKVKAADLAETKGCGLARVMRRELRRRGIEHVKVVYSEEKAIRPESGHEEGPIHPEDGRDDPSADNPAKKEKADPKGRRGTPGSMVFVPAASGILIASEVVKDLLGK